jgi:hypothetical protein
LGGLVVVATSAPTALWLDVATFLVSTITLLGVHESRPAPALAKHSILKDMSLGFTYVIKRPWMASVIKSKTPGRVAMLAALLPIPQLLRLAFNLPLWLLLASSVLAGVGLAMFGIILTTSLQTKVNPEVLGRVFAFDAFSSTGLAPVGFAVAGWAISYAGTSDVALGAIVILVISVLVPLLAVPGVASFADSHPDDRRATASPEPDS